MDLALGPRASTVVAVKEGDKDSKKVLRDKALDKGAANEAADMGTALHAMTVRAEDATDVDFDPGEPFQTDLDAYRDCLATYGLVSEMFECPMVNDHFRAAGTADRIYRLTKDLATPGGVIPAGQLVLGDLKTGQKFDFSLPGYAIQLALYATGTLYDLTTQSRLPTPPTNGDWAILVHLPVGQGRCELQWVSIEIGNYGAWIAQEVKQWRKKWKNGEYDGVPIPLPVDAIAEEFDATVEIDQEMVPALIEYVRIRVEQIGRHSKAKERLILKWPAGVPTPKQGLSMPGQVLAVLDVLDKIEADFSLPFLPDPRGEPGVHRSKIEPH